MSNNYPYERPYKPFILPPQYTKPTFSDSISPMYKLEEPLFLDRRKIPVGLKIDNKPNFDWFSEKSKK